MMPEPQARFRIFAARLAFEQPCYKLKTTRAILVSTSPYLMFNDGTQSTFDVTNKAAGLPERMCTLQTMRCNAFTFITPFNCTGPLLPSLSTKNQRILAMFSSNSWNMMKS